ncbi:MAG: cell division protein ZipA [Gammaproteobacteria bacterium]|nr:cell division protein ZipA [Gammaproteobacteria bacterium]MBT8150259.1 cell division protein ZipA [Gammaproteobacteria bacterium]NND38355.1 cell division protein ZipA [Pseudomonadales bacterium]NNM12345.1 cell division protein ZipA [Pseudomonadales bacterium]RZV57923.1 MAG: cell division protein ZipA [Pseudomonadales bacterium]
MSWLSDIGMREWLLICGVVLVLVVLADGFRRMQNERRGKIKMARRLGGGFPEQGIAEPFNSELPNGGARVIGRSEPSLSEAGLSDAAQAQDMADVQAFHDSLETHRQAEPDDEAAQRFVSEEQLLVLHVRARNQRGFNGTDLLQVLLACDMRYGDRDILHRHERAGGNGSLQFSVANMVEPGTFNLEDINSFRTPGISFFMSLPGPDNTEEAFECMLETANCVVKNLDAELLDEHHQPASVALIESLRDRARSFATA